MSTLRDRWVRGQAGAPCAKRPRRWPPGPDKPRLRRDQIHLWLAPLHIERARLGSHQALLSAEERIRAGRFYFGRDCERFAAGRGLLRKILARYLGESPQLIRFCRNLYGKPALATDPGPAGVRFSVSHSHGLALYALSLGREVGVDLERLRFDRGAEEIAGQFFSAGEQATLLSMPEPARTEAFFRCWTVKEAYLKAKGLGLWRGLEGLVVTFEGDGAKVWRCAAAQPDEENDWVIKMLEPEPGYAAALVAAGSNWSMKIWRWPEEW